MGTLGPFKGIYEGCFGAILGLGCIGIMEKQMETTI